ncbi:hypothetical protein, partial [Hydrotalea sp.]|uniref:hypothetical protein n=1 Tax=Hydrotalea sp. TaxID=2881279 RepID=UPI002612B2EC
STHFCFNSNHINFFNSNNFFLRTESFSDKNIQIDKEIKIKYTENNIVKDIETESVSRVIRNSLAHNSENNFKNIKYENNKIIFQQDYNNKNYIVEFDIKSFHKFVIWLIKNSRETIKKKSYK